MKKLPKAKIFIQTQPVLITGSYRTVKIKRTLKRAEGICVSTSTRVKGIKEDTILRWLREAVQHAEQIDEVLIKEFRIERGRLDAHRAYVRNKGEKRYPETGESG